MYLLVARASTTGSGLLLGNRIILHELFYMNTKVAIGPPPPPGLIDITHRLFNFISIRIRSVAKEMPILKRLKKFGKKTKIVDVMRQI